MWLLAKPFLLGAWRFLRGLPWQLWAGLALLALGLFYGHLRFNAGQAEVQGRFDAYKARMLAATDAARIAAKRAETLSRTAMDAALLAREKGKTDAQAKGAGVTAGIKSGSVRLQNHWACPANVPAAAEDPGKRDEGAGLRAESAGRIVGFSADADAEVTYFQNLVRANPQCFTVKP